MAGILLWPDLCGGAFDPIDQCAAGLRGSSCHHRCFAGITGSSKTLHRIWQTFIWSFRYCPFPFPWILECKGQALIGQIPAEDRDSLVAYGDNSLKDIYLAKNLMTCYKYFTIQEWHASFSPGSGKISMIHTRRQRQDEFRPAGILPIFRMCWILMIQRWPVKQNIPCGKTPDRPGTCFAARTG